VQILTAAISKEDFVNKRQLATKCGVSLSTIDHWIGKGAPHTQRKDGGYDFNLKAVRAWRETHIRPKVEAAPDLLKAKARKEQALAEKHETQLAALRGTLINREQVNRFLFSTSRQTRDAFLSLPDRLAGPLAAESDQHKVHQMITTECRRILEDLAKLVEQWEDTHESSPSRQNT
jgi:phage terminase Nu1 subunit (DNA packaging protein)